MGCYKSTFCFLQKIKTWIATSEATPKIPSNPEIKAVNRLIGTWIPKFAPKTFKKNNNKAPMTSFTDACPNNFIDRRGAPIISSNIMIAIIMIITIVELIHSTSLTLLLSFEKLFSTSINSRNTLMIPVITSI